jgi:hypothetical protein
MTIAAHEDQRGFAVLLEMRHVRAMQINFSRAVLRRDENFWQTAVATGNFHASGNLVSLKSFEVVWHNDEHPTVTGAEAQPFCWLKLIAFYHGAADSDAAKA